MKWIMKQKKETICIANITILSDKLRMRKGNFKRVMKYLEAAGIVKILQVESNIMVFDYIVK